MWRVLPSSNEYENRKKTDCRGRRPRRDCWCSRRAYYDAMCDELANGAIAAIERAGATWDTRCRSRSAGTARRHRACGGDQDAMMAMWHLGCVLRGETTHYDMVANESARGIMDLTLAGLCIGNGILTCENEAQAWARARANEMDKGGGAADAALSHAPLKRSYANARRRRNEPATPPRALPIAPPRGWVRYRRSTRWILRALTSAKRWRNSRPAPSARTSMMASAARRTTSSWPRSLKALCASRQRLIPFVDKQLDAEWPLHRLDATIRAILRAAAYELMFMERVPGACHHQRICVGHRCVLRWR